MTVRHSLPPVRLRNRCKSGKLLALRRPPNARVRSWRLQVEAKAAGSSGSPSCRGRLRVLVMTRSCPVHGRRGEHTTSRCRRLPRPIRRNRRCRCRRRSRRRRRRCCRYNCRRRLGDRFVTELRKCVIIVATLSADYETEIRMLENNPIGLERVGIERVVGKRSRRLLRQQPDSKALSASKGITTADRGEKNRRPRNRFEGNCFNCGRKGHRAED